MKTNRLALASLHAALAWIVLSAAGFFLARPVLNALGPLIESATDALQSDFLSHVTVSNGRSGPTLTMTCEATRQLTLPSGKVIPFLGSFRCASSDALHAMVPIVIFLAAITGWPARGRREILLRALLASVFLPVVLVLTTPPLLAGLVETGLRPEGGGADPLDALLRPFVFIEMGGCWLLPLLAAFLTLRLTGAFPNAPAPYAASQ